MSFNPSAKDEGNGGNYELTPEGPTVARCARVIEIGQQVSERFGTIQNKAVIIFSLPNHFIDLGGEQKQKFISQPFGINMSNNEASTMAKYVKALNPAAENLGDFINRPCQIYIAHFARQDGNGKGERIDSISPLLPGIEVAELDTDPFWFQWENPDPALWPSIGPFTRRLIKEAKNYPGSKVEKVVLEAEAAEASNESSGTKDEPF